MMLFGDSIPFHKITQSRCGCECSDTCLKGICECIDLSHNVSFEGGRRIISSSSVVYDCIESCNCKGCSNIVDTNLVNPDLYIFDDHSEKGKGVKSHSDISAGEYIISYTGEYLSPEEGSVREKAHHEKYGHNYVMCLRELLPCGKVVSETCIDAACDESQFPVCCYFNHSCDPNMFVIPIRKESLFPIPVFFAKTFIPKDTELTYDYAESSANLDYSRKRCLCGAENCKIYLT